MSQRLVSVVIPAFNPRRSLLRRAISSVLNQSYPEIEIIVCNDGSVSGASFESLGCSGTAARCNQIRVLKHAVRMGISAARNTCVAASNGKYITWLDSDDELHPNAIQKLVSAVDNSLLVIGDCIVSERGNRTRRSPHILLESAQKYFRTKNDPFLRNVTSLQPQLIRREVFEQLGGFDRSFEFAEMTEFFLRFLTVFNLGDIAFEPDALYSYYRDRPDSVSSNRDLLFSYRLQALNGYKERCGIDGILEYSGRNEKTGFQSYSLVCSEAKVKL